uniref:Protein kinase domain-containing protein n=1 Tax=Acrobeloides nanus TaxID=290746 RepID=A0A914DVE6_9BILA
MQILTSLYSTSITYEGQSLSYKSLAFTADQMTILGNSNEPWNGFLIRYEAIPEMNSGQKRSILWIIFLFVGVFLICLMAIGLLVYYLRVYKNREKYLEGVFGILKDMQMSADDIIGFKEKTDDMFIPAERLFINTDHVLGQGSCSTVYKGHLRGSSALHAKAMMLETQRFCDCEIAVKAARTNGEGVVIEQLYKEIKVMKELGYYEHIMPMLGWTELNETPCLVFDIAQVDLLQHVRSLRNVDPSETPFSGFTAILWQVAKGMQYISSKAMVHRDLAARNILLCGDSKAAKIGDFGLCCKCDETFTYQASLSKRLPFKWLALESLVDHIFSEKSDIWSFGVLMYEMYNLGQVPYPDLSHNELIDFLKSGKRLAKPKDMPEDMHEVVRKCWEEEPQNRPNFTELEKIFYTILEDNSEGYEFLKE